MASVRKDPDEVQAAKFLSIIRRFGYERGFRFELDCCLAKCSTNEEKRKTFLWCVGRFAESVRQQVNDDRARMGKPRGKEWEYGIE